MGGAQMTPDEARHEVISAIDFAAYRETDFSLHDADKNRLFGSEHYNSGRPVYGPSRWAGGDFEKKMAVLLGMANGFIRPDTALREAQRLLEKEESILGRVIHLARHANVDDISDWPDR
jgi:hypothetical protein